MQNPRCPSRAVHMNSFTLFCTIFFPGSLCALCGPGCLAQRASRTLPGTESLKRKPLGRSVFHCPHLLFHVKRALHTFQLHSTYQFSFIFPIFTRNAFSNLVALGSHQRDTTPLYFGNGAPPRHTLPTRYRMQALLRVSAPEVQVKGRRPLA